MSADFFIEHKLSKGVVVDYQLLELIREESHFVEAYSKALSLLSRQSYTKFNIKRKLVSKEFDEAGINKALAYLEQQGYIDDEKYARRWVEGRLRNKFDSYNSLYAGLVNKGISGSVARVVLRDLYTEDINANAIRKSIIKYRNLGKTDDYIIGNLSRKGFNTGLIRRLLEES